MSDIKLIRGKYYDFKPKNDSFRRTAYELKQLGIKNFYFMLRIDNPRVADIDPFKPNITRQEVEALMQEMKGNMWFYARTVARIRTTAGVLPFELHRGLCAAMWCFERGQDHLLCEPRQTFKTTGLISAAFTWAFQIGTRDSHFKFMGKSHDNTKDNLAHLKDDISLLPEWLQLNRYVDKDKKIKTVRQASETVRNPVGENYATSTPEAASISKAMSIARGKSSPLILWDEFEFTPYSDVILANSAPIFKTASENAKAAGRPYCRSFLTTPGDLDSPEGRRAYPIIQSMIPWTEKIYDMTEEQMTEYKSAYQEQYHSDETKQREREVVDIFYIEYQFWQVRKDYKWVMEQYKLSGDKMAIRREILLQRLRGSSSNPFAPEDIEYLIANMRKSDKDLLINDKWRFRLYDHGQGMGPMNQLKDLDENIPYIVGIDPAGGGAGDNTAITILNPYNLQIAAEFKSPYISGTDIVRLLITLIHEHIPKAVLIPEKNSLGIYLIQMIYDSSIRENLYWSDSERQLEQMTEESEEDFKLREAAAKWKKYGTYLTVSTRKAMIELLKKHINECKDILLTEYLVEDICKLIQNPNTQKIAAGKGEHDDCLFSYLHAVYLYYTGDNLEIFGIVKSDHPILGPLEIDSENKIAEKDHLSGFFSTEAATYESIVIEDSIRLEEQVKYIVEKLPFVQDEVYSKRRDQPENPFDDTVSINPFFFDMLNN